MRRNYFFAILIAFIGGFVGLQEFYVGRFVRGLLGIMFCWTFIPSLIAFVEICRWLYDGEESWNKQYSTNKYNNKNNSLLID